MRNSKIAWGVALASTVLAVGQYCLAPSKVSSDRQAHSVSSGQSVANPQALSQTYPTHLNQLVKSEGFFGSLLLPQLRGWLGNDYLAMDWEQVLPPVMVAHTPLGDASTQISTAERRQNFWRRCTASTEVQPEPVTPSSATQSATRPELQSVPQAIPQTNATQGMFQVWVKGCLVAEFPSQDEAKQTSEALTQVLQDPQVDLSKLHLTLVDGKPTVRLGDRTLFTVTPELAQRLDQNPELLAIAWINQLRQAFGHARLDLAQAQQQMYQLQSGSETLKGVASWYGPYFHGRITATGEVFNQYDLTAAHRDLPFDTYLKITNLKNGRQVVVRINDRGPYFEEERRIIDLSYRAATVLGSDEKGIAPIEAVILQPAPGSTLTTAQRIANTVIMPQDP
jgi:Lytic transglycolase